MSKPGKPSAEDIEEFRRQVGPVRRVQHDRIQAARVPVAPRPRRRGDMDPADMSEHWSDQADMHTAGADDALLFARSGLQHRQLQQLRRGHFPVHATLDLHGLNSAQARQTLAAFLSHCQARHIRHALVVHGKGYGSREDAPVLKNRVNTWLRQHQDVLAFSSARPEHGGTGALYVLLRARRQSGTRGG